MPTGNSAYTLATWFNPDTSGARGLVGWGTYGTANQVNALRLGAPASQQLLNYWWSNDLNVGAGADLTPGDAPAGWHHTVATYDPVSHEHRIYLDGKQVAARVANNSMNATATNFAVGRTGAVPELFDGQLDDTAIYNNVLTPNQVVALSKGAATAGNLPAASPLVGLWRFENAGNAGFDSSGVENHLIANGNAQTGTGGKFGNGLVLDGNGDFLAANVGGTAAATGIPFGDGSYAIAAWFKPDAALNPQATNNGIVGWGNYAAGNQVTAIRMNGANGLSHFWWSADQTVGSQPNLVDGEFHHVVAMYDNILGVRALYLDGNFIGQDNPADHNSGFLNFAIGRTTVSLNEFFFGTLDDVAIFNRALTLDEIDAIRAGDFSAFGITIPEPATALTGMIGLALLGLRRRRTA